MIHFRAYVDRKKGGDHVRVLDLEIDEADEFVALDAARTAALADLKRGETVGQVVRIHPSPADSDGRPSVG